MYSVCDPQLVLDNWIVYKSRIDYVFTIISDWTERTFDYFCLFVSDKNTNYFGRRLIGWRLDWGSNVFKECVAKEEVFIKSMNFELEDRFRLQNHKWPNVSNVMMGQNFGMRKKNFNRDEKWWVKKMSKRQHKVMMW